MKVTTTLWSTAQSSQATEVFPKLTILCRAFRQSLNLLFQAMLRNAQKSLVLEE